MVIKKPLINIEIINKKIECDGYKFFYLYTKLDTRKKDLFICYTNNDELYLRKASEDAYFFKSGSLSAMIKSIELQSFEKCANILSFYTNDEKNNQNLERFDKGYFYVEIATNLGVVSLFELEISNYGKTANLSFKHICQFSPCAFSTLPAPFIKKKTSQNQKNTIEVLKHNGDYQYPDETVQTPSLDEFKNSVNAVTNYFTNLNNYTVGGWGGVGAVKGVREESKRRGKLRRYARGLGVAGIYPIVEINWGAELKGNDEVSAFTTDTGLPPTYMGVMPSDDELFDMMFNRAEKMFFIPPTISFTKNGNDLKFNDNVSVDLVDDFIFLYLELGKEIKE